MDFQAIRREYLKGGLDDADLTANPLDLFSRWLQDAIDIGLPDANACEKMADAHGHKNASTSKSGHNDQETTNSARVHHSNASVADTSMALSVKKE